MLAERRLPVFQAVASKICAPFFDVTAFGALIDTVDGRVFMPRRWKVVLVLDRIDQHLYFPGSIGIIALTSANNSMDRIAELLFVGSHLMGPS